MAALERVSSKPQDKQATEEDAAEKRKQLQEFEARARAFHNKNSGGA